MHNEEGETQGRRGFSRSLEMTISREEFLRLLPEVAGPFEVDPMSEAPVVSLVGQASVLARTLVTIRLVPLPALQFGSVALPRHRADITLDDCSDAEGEAFMERFRRAFLRAGG